MGSVYPARATYVPSFEEGKWARNPPFLFPDQPWEGNAVNEPRVAQLSSTSFILIFSANGQLANQGLGLMVSSDGKNWTKPFTHPVIGQGYGGNPEPAGRPTLYKVSATNIECYYTGSIPGPYWWRVTSFDGGLTWDNREIILDGGDLPGGTIGYNNSQIILDGSTYYLAMELSNSNGTYSTHLYSSSDRTSWSYVGEMTGLKLSSSGGSSACYFGKEGSVYHLYCHCALDGILPTEIFHFTSTDRISWVNRGMAFPINRELGTSELGELDQTADVRFAFVGSEIIAYYTRCNNIEPLRSNITLATYTGTLASLY